MYSLNLTIGHNINGIHVLNHDAVASLTAKTLGLEAFTLIPCVGWWRGEREESSRIEICGLTEERARELRGMIPTLARALSQVEIMAEVRADRVEFIAAGA